MAKEANKSDIIQARQGGMAIAAIAVKFDIDKIDVRDICKDVKRTPSRAKAAEKNKW